MNELDVEDGWTASSSENEEEAIVERDVQKKEKRGNVMFIHPVKKFKNINEFHSTFYDKGCDVEDSVIVRDCGRFHVMNEDSTKVAKLICVEMKLGNGSTKDEAIADYRAMNSRAPQIASHGGFQSRPSHGGSRNFYNSKDRNERGERNGRYSRNKNPNDQRLNRGNLNNNQKHDRVKPHLSSRYDNTKQSHSKRYVKGSREGARDHREGREGARDHREGRESGRDHRDSREGRRDHREGGRDRRDGGRSHREGSRFDNRPTRPVVCPEVKSTFKRDFSKRPATKLPRSDSKPTSNKNQKPTNSANRFSVFSSSDEDSS